MEDSPFILSLETATLGGSVWLGRGGLELAYRTGDPGISQSNTLLRDIDSCLAEASVSLRDIEVFACAAGPGSFTGLRIGISTLKALAATLARPVVGIPTLHAVAHAAGPSKATVALLPAGRGEVFAQMFSVATLSGEMIVEDLDAAAHSPPHQLIERYGELPVIRWAGSGAHLHRDTIELAAQNRGVTFGVGIAEPFEPVVPGWELAPDNHNLAKHVAALAGRAYQQGLSQQPEELHAIYVRPSDADLATK